VQRGTHPSSHAAFREVAFHECLASGERDVFKPGVPMRRDSAAMQRAIALLAAEADCVNTSGIRGYDSADIQRMSGFLMAPPALKSDRAELACREGSLDKAQPQSIPICALGN
jgi:hypothetical protein